ncbi:MAG: Flp family type IVb pilin [Paenibacillaceae bacterium]
MLNKLKGLVVEEKGQGMTEYGLVLGVIAIAVVGILLTLKTQIIALFKAATDALTTATP